MPMLMVAVVVAVVCSVLATSFGHSGCKYHAGALNEYAVDGASLCANTASTPLVKVLVS